METDFPTTKEYNKDKVKKVQERLYEMASEVADILEANNFPYMIAFGTLLGSVRHKGFVPWDDDFDMFLFDDTYDAAMECLRKNLSSNLIVHDKLTDPIYWPFWSRIRDKNSTAVSEKYTDDNFYKYTGLTVDLYRLVKVKRGTVDLYCAKRYIEFLVRKHEVGVMKDEEYEKKFHEGCLNYEKIWQAAPKSDAPYDEYAFVETIKLIKEKEIFPLKKYTFGNREFFGPNDYDPILKRCYGDYMNFPPYEERAPHYSKVEMR